ncbi:MAG: SAM-dependent methyltransferase [Clostridia bacterium]|nr:SAM-dependent methyltransferase [Clostridia bacterium]
MENIKLNERLMTAVQFVREGSRLADVGTDHGYLPIFLILEGRISFAIAADINRGPLDKADENIHKYALDGKIKTVLCDGLTRIDKREVDDIAIFGMGGELIVNILDEAPWLKDTAKRLILQPMTHPEKLRKYLADNGYSIIGEALSFDRGKIYQTICAEYDGIIREFDEITLLYGEYILKNGGELLSEQMEMDSKKLLRKIEGKRAGGEDVSYESDLLENIKKIKMR